MLELVVITLGCFVAAFVNAAFATGGVYIMLASVSAVLPLTATIPLIPAFAMPSLFARICFFWKQIQWQISKSFIIGSVFGVWLGGNLFVSLTESQIAIMMGCLILLLTWLPSIRLPLPQKHLFVTVGVSHSFLGTLFGVGAILQPTMLRTSLLKGQITGTLAASLFSMDIFKVVSYVSNGFSYLDYLPHIGLAIVAGFAGAWLGKRVTHQISETTFRAVFKLLITLVALRLLLKGLLPLWQGCC